MGLGRGRAGVGGAVGVGVGAWAWAWARSNYLMISSLGAEVIALRETIRGLDPTFAEVLAQKRARTKTAKTLQLNAL